MLAASSAGNQCNSYLQRILFPRADITNSTANSAVTVDLIDHRVYFHHFHRKHPPAIAQDLHRQMSLAIGQPPPLTGVPTPGAESGSSASISSET